MKKHTATLFAALAAFGAWAATETVDGIAWKYRVVDGNAEIYNNDSAAIYNTTSGAITIPSTLGGYLVTSIGKGAFFDCSGLTGVTIPNSVTSIGRNAFYWCSGLTNVTISEGVTSIGDSAFYWCSGLTSVTIPDSVTSIGYEAFCGCNDALFDKTTIAGVNIVDRWVIGNTGSLAGDLDLTGVRGIGDVAFRGCSWLTSVTIGNGVKSIGSYAFKDCNGLTRVTIGNGVTSIGYEAFSGCSDLTSVTIPDSVTSIGDSAFMGCSGLTSVTMGNGVTNIGSCAFKDCNYLTSVTIGNGVTSVGYEAFSGCGGLTSVTIPDSVTRIGPYAFSGCSGLTSVTIPDSVTSIGYEAFSGCSGLTSITMPNSVTNIGGRAFIGCGNVREATVPGSACGIPFDNVTNLVVSAGATNIGSSAFSGCSGLTSVTIPDSVTRIRSYAFSGCSGLTSVTIPDSVTRIEWRAFSGCRTLTSVIMPRIKYDSSVFEDCSPNLVIRYWDEMEKKFRLALKPNLPKSGTVSGGGKYVYGFKATLKATAKKGYVFAGWFTDKACTKPLNPEGYDNRKPTVKVAMPAKDTTIYAKFLTKTADKSSLKFKSATKKLAKTPAKATAGEAFSLKLGVSSASLTTFAAKGLPKGLSIDKATGEITGVGTVPGSYTATVTVKSAAGNKITQKVKITVTVPSWAKGTFYALAYPGVKADDSWAYLKFTATEEGKVSGKAIYKGKSYSFTSSYKNCAAKKVAFTPKIKIGGSTFKPGSITVKSESWYGVAVVVVSDKYGFVTGQKKPGKNICEEYSALLGRTFVFTSKDANSGLTRSTDRLMVAIGDSGSVTVSGVVGGKKLSPLSWILSLSGSTGNSPIAPRLDLFHVDIIDSTLKYERRIVFHVYQTYVEEWVVTPSFQ